jgi:hypothetical protein
VVNVFVCGFLPEIREVCMKKPRLLGWNIFEMKSLRFS